MKINLTCFSILAYGVVAIDLSSSVATNDLYADDCAPDLMFAQSYLDLAFDEGQEENFLAQNY